MRSLLMVALVLTLTGCGALRSRDCGKEGQPCCSAETCETPLGCEAGTCRTRCEPCPTPSATCASDGERSTCTEVDGCARWTSTACASGSRCESGACVDVCPGACTPDAALCTPEGLKVCSRPPAPACPAYETVAVDSPLCRPSLCDGAYCWESPLPQGNPLVALSGNRTTNQVLALDWSGNVLDVTAAQWTYSLRRSDGRPVHALAACPEPSRALAVGANGLVLKLNGSSWTTEAFPESVNLRAVDCATGVLGLATGAGGELFVRPKSAIWSRVSSPTSVPLYGAAIYFPTSDGWAVGQGGTIVRVRRVDDAALTTTSLEGVGTTPEPLRAVSASDNGEIFAVGDKGVVLRRYGLDWTPEDVETDVDLFSVGTASGGRAYVGGSGGAFFYRSSTVWLPASFTTNALGAVWANDGSRVYASESRGLWRNDRAGSDAPSTPPLWQRVAGEAPSARHLLALHGRSSADLYAVGSGGTLLHRAGEVWRPEDAQAGTEALHAVAVLSNGEAVVAGQDGFLAVRSPLTGTWSSLANPTGELVLGLWSDGATVYAVGDKGLWMERQAGGEFQARAHGLTTAPLFTVLGGPNGEVWAAGGECTVLRKNSAGFGRELIPGCTDALFLSGAALGGEVLLGTFNGTLYRSLFDSWSTDLLPTLSHVHGVVAAKGTFFALCSDGELFQRSGTTWLQEAKYLTYHSLLAGYASPQGDLFIAGDHGLIWRRR